MLAWGNNSSRQCDIPAALSGVVSIAAGANVTLALRAEGMIDTFRGINNKNYWPEDAAGIVAISANGYGCFAIKSDGTIIHGKSGSDVRENKMLPPADLINVRSVVVGRGSCAAFKDDGTGIFWGQLTGNFNVNIPTSASRVVGLAVGDSFVLVWGDNGVLEKKGLGMNRELTFPSGLGKVRDVVLGEMHAVALLQDGTVVAWGRNDKGQSTVPAGLSGAVAIAAGKNHTVVLKSDGTVVAWGDNSKGQCAVPADLGGVVAIATGDEHTVALRLD